MKCESTIICDFAATYGGKLNITGAFTDVVAETFPHKIARCYYVAVFYIEKEEAGPHRVQIELLDETSAKLEGGMEERTMSFPWFQAGSEERITRVNLNICLNNLVLPKTGLFRMELQIDSKVIGSAWLCGRIK